MNKATIISVSAICISAISLSLSLMPPTQQESECNSVPVPHYDRGQIDTIANVIVDSTGSLAPFYDKLATVKGSDDDVVTILHIGDSHVQAGVWTNRVREQLQSQFGNAGRGLVVPYKLAGMNEPRDYGITTRWAHHTTKATEKDTRSGPTGVAVTFDVPYNEFEVWSKEPFSCITVLHSPGAPSLHEPDFLYTGMYCDIDNTAVSTRFSLLYHVDTLRISGFVQGKQTDPTFYGFVLENGNPGVLYHATGVNGASFEHMAEISKGSLKSLNPDLIIVSLGTNNCFGSNFQQGQLHNVVDRFVRDVKESYPEAAVLLTTPMEACRRVRKRYDVNTNLGVAAEVIRQAAKDNDVAYWDFYTAAGGQGAMKKWHDCELANRDHIHLTADGYTLQGDMLYDAMVRGFNDYVAR